MGTNNSYFRGMIWASGGNFIGMAASLATVMVAARLVGKEDLGAFFLVNIVILFAGSLGDLGLRNTAIKFLSETEGDELVVLSRYFWTINIITAIGTGILLAISLPFLFILWPDLQFRQVAWFSIPATTFQIIYQMGISLFIGIKRFKLISVISSSVEIVRMILTVFGILMGMGYVALLWGVLLSRVLLVFIMGIKLRPYVGIVLTHRRGGEILRFGGWLQASAIMSAITFRMVDGLLASLLGTAALAIYSLAMQIPASLQRIFESIRPVLLGYISTQNHSGEDISKEGVRLLSGLLCLASLFLILFSEPLVKLVFSSRYLAAVPIMQLLCTWVAFGIVNYFLSLTLLAKGYSRRMFILTIPQFFVMVIGCLLLVPKWQGIGAAVSLIITSITGNFIGFFFIAGGNRKEFSALCSAFMRPASPLLLLIPIILILKPSIIFLACSIPLLILLLQLSGGLTVADIQKLFKKTQINNAEAY